MRKVLLAAALLAGATCLSALPCRAQFARHDYIWARTTDGAPLTLDGRLNEAAWAKAESVVVHGRSDNGIPGSGWKDEGGFPATDKINATFKFLVVNNQLWMGAVVRDSSIGGSKDFNRFDGLLMNIANHANGSHPASSGEHLWSWWWADDSGDPNPLAVDHAPSFRGEWRDYPPGVVTPTQLQAWDAAYTVQGHVNTDAAVDTSYTVEMRFDLPLNGYDATKPGGDVVEFNVSVYDCDWYWPLANFFRFAVNRTWLQGPWGNTDWYDDEKIHVRNDVTINSGPVPVVGPDLTIPNAGNYAAPVIDGALTEPVWAVAPHIDIRYDDPATRDAYPSNGPWRSGQYQPVVNGNGGTAFVSDPANCRVKYFYKADTLYLGFDFQDQVVQYHSLRDRWDGAIVTITDRTARFSDNNLATHPITFQVGPTGQLKGADEMPNLRDTLHVVRAQLQLKPGTTVDTLGADVDQGYTAEMAVDLTAMGYAPDLGDHALYFGIDILDGDSYSPITDSYGTRTWFFREREGIDGPCVGFLDPGSFVAGVDGGVDHPKLALLGNFPNPFRRATTIRYSLAEDAVVTLDVFDLQGRNVASRPLGLQTAGAREVFLPQFTGRSGLYLYRMRIADRTTGATRNTLTGKMMVMQ